MHYAYNLQRIGPKQVARQSLGTYLGLAFRDRASAMQNRLNRGRSTSKVHARPRDGYRRSRGQKDAIRTV